MLDGESDFHAATPDAIAFFAAFVGLPSFFVVVCPVAVAMPAALMMVAALSGVLSLHAAMLSFAALSEGFFLLAAMLNFAALSDGCGGYACCDGYSLKFLPGDVKLNEMEQVFLLALVGHFAPAAVENTRLFLLLEMVQVVLCVEHWVPGSSSQEMEEDLFEWVEVESYEPKPPCTMINTTPHTFDLVGEARKRGWCEHELMYHIFKFGTLEEMRSMHMMALASAEDGSESVLRGRIMEFAAENSVVFLGGVLQDENSVGESSSSSWQWPWAASGEVNMWNPLLSAMADVAAEPFLDDLVSEVDMGRAALTCHFPLDVLCSEMHEPHVFLPQVLSLDELIPVNEVRQACGISEPAKSVQILFCGGHGLGAWVLEAYTTLAQWFFGGKRVGDEEGYFSTLGGRILNSEVEVGTLGLGQMSQVVFHRRLLGGSFACIVQSGSIPGTGEFGQWTCSNCGKPDCWSMGVLVILMQLGLGKCILVGKAMEEGWRVLRVMGLEVG